MQCIVSAFRAGYEHGMYHPSTCCQVSYIPSSGWGGSCLPSGTSPTLIISAQERFSPNPNSFLTKILKILSLYFVSKQIVVQQNMQTIWCHCLNSVNIHRISPFEENKATTSFSFNFGHWHGCLSDLQIFHTFNWENKLKCICTVSEWPPIFFRALNWLSVKGSPVGKGSQADVPSCHWKRTENTAEHLFEWPSIFRRFKLV